jgi:hypothetical protein
MTAENDFLKARTQIAARIKKLESDLNYWRDELKAFDRVETTMRRLVNNSGDSVTALTLEGESQVDRPEVHEVPDTPEERSRLLLQLMADPPRRRGELRNRVLEIVNEKKGGKVTATEVERAILQSGFKPGGKHFDVAVFQTLNRLADGKKIARKKYAGKVTFSANAQ